MIGISRIIKTQYTQKVKLNSGDILEVVSFNPETKMYSLKNNKDTARNNDYCYSRTRIYQIHASGISEIIEDIYPANE